MNVKSNWHGGPAKTDALNHFLKKYSEKKLVILELGIGSRNTMIKQPLMNFAEQTEKVKYITLNLEHELFIPNAIKHKSIGLSGNIASTLHQLNNLMKK